MKRRIILVPIAMLLLLAACSSGPDNSGYRQRPAGEPATAAQQPAAGGSVASSGQETDFNAPGIPEVRGAVQTTASGLRFIDERPGNGPWPQMGQNVRVHYTGWLTDGRKFDSSLDRGQPFVFPLGQGQVIRGWDEGVATMRPGGKRRLVLTPPLAYGAQGTGPIPPNATLIFDVEFLGAQ